MDRFPGLWYTQVQNFGFLSCFLRCKEDPCPLSPDLGLWRRLKVPDSGLESWPWFGYGQWSLKHPCSTYWLSILILKVQRTAMSFRSLFGALEDAGGSWLGFGILISIWIRSLLFDTLMFHILAMFRPCLDHIWALFRLYICTYRPAWDFKFWLFLLVC